ncbi:MAG: hypothetical protein HWD59_02435 [Coxiellaceae bacterium]|nr:MAG: hypothetical protein HWD59_02435 [Coxiellaceae bacterium]
MLEYAAKLQAVLAYFNIESFALSFEMAELMLQEIFSTGKIYSEISPQKLLGWLAENCSQLPSLLKN